MRSPRSTNIVRFWLVELMKDSTKSWDIPLYLTNGWTFIRFTSGHKIAKFNSKKEADDAVRSPRLSGAPIFKLRIRCLEIDPFKRRYRWIPSPSVSVQYVGNAFVAVDDGIVF